MTPRPAVRPARPSGSPFRDRPVPEIEEYAVDDRVTHEKFGLGRVVVLEASAVVVEFGAQRVRVDSPFRRLTKL